MPHETPIQLSLPGVPVPAHGLQELAEAQRAFLAAFEHYQRLLGMSGFDSVES